MGAASAGVATSSVTEARMAAPVLPSPLEFFQSVSDEAESQLAAMTMALPHLLQDIAQAVQRSSPGGIESMGRAIVTAAAASIAYLLLVRLLRERRRRAASERVPVLAIIKLTAWELLPLIGAIVVARAFILRGFDHPPWAAEFPAEFAQNFVRWLSATTFLTIVFRPDNAQLRLVDVDEAGARLAVRWGTAILGFGYLHAVLLAAGQRAGLPPDTTKLVALLACSGMVFATFRLLLVLKSHGLRPVPRLLANCMIASTSVLWIWGWASQDFDFYRGLKGTIAFLLIALVFDRAFALSIRLSRRPSMIRGLFVARVTVGALASAAMVRIVAEYWLVGTFAFMPMAEWPAYSRRVNFALLLLVTAAFLAALSHVWVEAKMSPPLAIESEEEKETRQARMATILPIARVTLLTLIASVFSLIALSALGVDITPVMAGAGILGLAVSLGSQALVKDIIAGIFCMLDDVFRLGETIEIGEIRGRVEQIRFRSLRLRGEDGRLHTIPFGEIATAAIIGPIKTRVRAGDGQEPAMVLSFQMLRAAAIGLEPVIAALVSEAAEECGLADAAQVKAVFADLSEQNKAFSGAGIPSTP
eukprot:g3869.t1